jgi:hypothetical protein
MSQSLAWRWTVPVVLAVALPVGSWIGRLRPTPDVPALPGATPAQIATRAAGAHPQPRSGSFVLSTGLGLGDLGTSSAAGGAGLLGLSAGTVEARVWSDGAGRSRVAQIRPLEEIDWIRSGATVWVWHSRGTRAVRVDAPGGLDLPVQGVLTAVGGSSTPVPTPEQLAARLLAFRDRATELSLGPPRRIAGRPAYDLVLTPRTAGSLLARIEVAVDATTGFPLEVSVRPRIGGQVIRDRYSSISFAEPNPSNFRFHPPPHADVTEAASVSAATADRGERGRREGDARRGRDVGDVPSIELVGEGWDEVVMARGLEWWRFRDLLRAGTPVSGSFGRGLLLRTRAFSVIALDDGRVVAGAVTPKRLEAAISEGA